MRRARCDCGAIWALHVTGQLSEDEKLALLEDPQPYVRGWAVQLICEDYDPSATAVSRMIAMAETDDSPVVRLYLAAAAQRVDDARDGSWSSRSRCTARIRTTTTFPR